MLGACLKGYLDHRLCRPSFRVGAVGAGARAGVCLSGVLAVPDRWSLAGRGWLAVTWLVFCDGGVMGEGEVVDVQASAVFFLLRTPEYVVGRGAGWG